MKTLPMTAAAYSVLERELKRRIQLDRPRLIERLQEAIADDSNLAENADYQAVKSEQEINEARIAELEDKLARARRRLRFQRTAAGRVAACSCSIWQTMSYRRCGAIALQLRRVHSREIIAIETP